MEINEAFHFPADGFLQDVSGNKKSLFMYLKHGFFFNQSLNECPGPVVGQSLQVETNVLKVTSNKILSLGVYTHWYKLHITHGYKKA